MINGSFFFFSRALKNFYRKVMFKHIAVLLVLALVAISNGSYLDYLTYVIILHRRFKFLIYLTFYDVSGHDIHRHHLRQNRVMSVEQKVKTDLQMKANSVNPLYKWRKLRKGLVIVKYFIWGR